MAPTTRSKDPKPAPTAAASPSKTAAGNSKKASKTKKPAAAAPSPTAETSPSKVQKKSSSKKKGKGKASKTSRISPSPRASPRASSASGSGSAPNSSSKTSPSKRRPAPVVEDAPEDDADFPELAQAYNIMPYLDNPQASPRPGTPGPFNPAAGAGNHMMNHFAQAMHDVAGQMFGPEAENETNHFAQRMDNRAAGHILRPDVNVLANQLAAHMVNPPAWANLPGMPVPGQNKVVPQGFEMAMSPPLFPMPTASGGMRAPGARFNEVAASKSDSTTSRPVAKRSADAAEQRQRSSSRGGGGGSSSGGSAPPPHGRGRRRERVQPQRRAASDGVVHDDVDNAQDEGEEEYEPRPESPVSVNNAQAFKRPTVANVRRERGQLHDELGAWVVRLRRARDDFDAVIGEIEERMQILRAVNRMQAPLRRAPLGRGR